MQIPTFWSTMLLYVALHTERDAKSGKCKFSASIWLGISVVFSVFSITLFNCPSLFHIPTFPFLVLVEAVWTITQQEVQTVLWNPLQSLGHRLPLNFSHSKSHRSSFPWKQKRNITKYSGSSAMYQDTSIGWWIAPLMDQQWFVIPGLSQLNGVTLE